MSGDDPDAPRRISGFKPLNDKINATFKDMFALLADRAPEILPPRGTTELDLRSLMGPSIPAQQLEQLEVLTEMMNLQVEVSRQQQEILLQQERERHWDEFGIVVVGAATLFGVSVVALPDINPGYLLIGSIALTGFPSLRHVQRWWTKRRRRKRAGGERLTQR